MQVSGLCDSQIESNNVPPKLVYVQAAADSRLARNDSDSCCKQQ